MTSYLFIYFLQLLYTFSILRNSGIAYEKCNGVGEGERECMECRHVVRRRLKIVSLKITSSRDIILIFRHYYYYKTIFSNFPIESIDSSIFQNILYKSTRDVNIPIFYIFLKIFVFLFSFFRFFIKRYTVFIFFINLCKISSHLFHSIGNRDVIKRQNKIRKKKLGKGKAAYLALRFDLTLNRKR